MLHVSTKAGPGWQMTTALWAISGFVFYVLGGFGSLLALATLETVLPPDLRPAMGSITLSIRNGLHLIVWAAVSAGASLVVGRRLVPGIRFSPGGWLLLSVGAGLAAFTMFLVNEDARARFGRFDPDFVGVSIFVGPAVLAIGLAAWAALAVPRGQGLLLALATAAAIGSIVLALLPSLPAAADGIDADHVPLATAFLADIGYAALAALVVVARVLPRPGRARSEQG